MTYFRKLIFLTFGSLGLTSICFAIDIYNPSNNQLSIPAVSVGNAVYTNVVVSVGTVLNVENGVPASAIDIYNPNTNTLTIPSVQVGSVTYTNVSISITNVLTVAGKSTRAGAVASTYLAFKVWNKYWKKTNPLQVLFDNGVRSNKVGVTTLSFPELENAPVSSWSLLPYSRGLTNDFQASYMESLEYSAQVLQDSQNVGMRLTANLYCSDTPQHAAQHNNPLLWKGFNLQQTADAVNQYTYTTTKYLMSKGLNIEYYSLGNELTDGFLDFSLGVNIAYPSSNIFTDMSFMINQVWIPESFLLKSAIAGIKRANPNAKIMIHGQGLGLSTNDIWITTFFQTLVQQGVPFDVAGLSMPYQQGGWPGPFLPPNPYYNSGNFLNTIIFLRSLGLQVRIAEYSYPNSPNGISGGYANGQPDIGYPFTPNGQDFWIRDFVTFLNNHPEIIQYDYFYPEFFSGMTNGSTINLESTGLFIDDTQAQPAMSEFINSQ